MMTPPPPRGPSTLTDPTDRCAGPDVEPDPFRKRVGPEGDQSPQQPGPCEHHQVGSWAGLGTSVDVGWGRRLTSVGVVGMAAPGMAAIVRVGVGTVRPVDAPGVVGGPQSTGVGAKDVKCSGSGNVPQGPGLKPRVPQAQGLVMLWGRPANPNRQPLAVAGQRPTAVSARPTAVGGGKVLPVGRF